MNYRIASTPRTDCHKPLIVSGATLVLHHMVCNILKQSLPGITALTDNIITDP